MEQEKNSTIMWNVIAPIALGIFIGCVAMFIMMSSSVKTVDKEIEPGHYISWVTQKVEAVGHEYSLWIFVMYNGDVVSVDQAAFNRVDIGQHVHYYEGDIIDVDVVSAGL